MGAWETILLVAATLGANDAVLLEFTSTNCSHCQTMQPIVRRLAEAGQAVQVIDMQQQPDVAARFKITGAPTFVMLSGGQEVGRIPGACSPAELAQLVARATPNTRPAIASNPVATTSSGAAPRKGLQKPKLQLVSQTSKSSVSSPAEIALAATVRLKIVDAKGNSFGTGTIIDTHGDEALILTCGHIFRESNGKGTILVDLFNDQTREAIEGELIRFDLERDLALVSIRPGVAVRPVQVAPVGLAATSKQPVFSIGCDKGADPRLIESHVTAVDRFQRAPNVSVAGLPVDGRSGGGLFTHDGLLVGVCNAANPADNEGLYASLPSIQWELDQLGLKQIYARAEKMLSQGSTLAVSEGRSRQEDSSDSAAAGLPELPAQMPEEATGSTALAESEEVPVETASPAFLNRAAELASEMKPAAGALTAAAASAASQDDTEVICIIQSRSNPGKRQIVVLNGVAPEMIQQLAAMGRAVTPSTTDGSRVALRERPAVGLPAGSATSPALEPPVVFRGQSPQRSQNR